MMNRQHGFSLIELMIALVLGLMVGGAVLQVFVMNNKSIVFQRASIITQDQGRVALDMMARYIRMAGYQEDNLSNAGLSNGIAGSTTGPSITVRYQAGASTMSSQLFDCLGNAISDGATSSGAISVNQFRLESDGGSMNNLVCQSTHSLDGDKGQGTLASNVEQMSILYGVDTDNDQAPNRYLNANAASTSMSSVVAIKICLVIASDDNMIGGTSPAYTDCDGNSVTPSDQRIRRKVGSTVSLRNRIGGSA
ncbi:MAG: PilW family protein [Halopseudomonas sp.]